MKWIKNVFHYIFVDGLSGMASGLFATFILGTIMEQISKYIPVSLISSILIMLSGMLKALMGAGIGVGVAARVKASPLVTVSAAITGMVGAYAVQLSNSTVFVEGMVNLKSPGEPMGAFIAVMATLIVGRIISDTTKLDIIITPFFCILAGGVAGIIAGVPVSQFMSWFGDLINWGTEQNPLIMGIVVSVLMGMALTLPISSSAIGISLGLSGLAAGAATVGCCCNMIGFAVVSFKENGISGLITQGLGTSMLQMPNIVRRPLIWIPAIVSSAVLGPVSTIFLKMTNTAVGSGMGTIGLVGPLASYYDMILTEDPVMVVLKIVMIYFVLPILISLMVGGAMRKIKLIKDGDMKLEV